MSRELEFTAAACKRLRTELDNLEGGAIGFLEYHARVEDIMANLLTNILHADTEKGREHGARTH